MRVPTCVHFELAGHSSDGSSLKKSVQKESSSYSRAKRERCLAAASSKQIGVGRASDLQWNDGRALSGRSVVIEADWSRQSERSSVERGERAISASACKTSGPKARPQIEVSRCRIKSAIASEEWREIANAANRATIACAETVRMGPFLCALDNDLATCMVRAARGRLSGFHVACLLTHSM